MGSGSYDIVKVELAGSPYEVRAQSSRVAVRRQPLRTLCPWQIGLQHGHLLASQIVDQITIYRDLFQEACKFSWETVRTVAAQFEESIGLLAPHLLEEMRGIAAGVQSSGHPKVDILDIVALNARSEIALGQWDDGCTALGWRIRGPGVHKQILAQNWDWREGVGKNLALASISAPGKPQIWMVIEVCMPACLVLVGRYSTFGRLDSQGSSGR